MKFSSYVVAKVKTKIFSNLKTVTYETVFIAFIFTKTKVKWDTYSNSTSIWSKFADYLTTHKTPLLSLRLWLVERLTSFALKVLLHNVFDDSLYTYVGRRPSDMLLVLEAILFHRTLKKSCFRFHWIFDYTIILCFW